VIYFILAPTPRPDTLLSEAILSTTASSESASPATALALVAQDMAKVDEVIADRLSSGVPLVGQVAQYIISAGGKRLRPVILLLTSGALNYQEHHK